MGAFLLEGAGINGAAIADIAVILIFLLFGIVGIAKGFTRKLFKSYGRILAFLLTAIFCGKFAIWLDDRFAVVDAMSGVFAGWIPKLFGESAAMPLEQFLAGGADEVSPLISGIVRSVCEGINIDPTASVIDICAPVFAFYAIQAISFIGLYIILRLLFLLIGLILSKIVHAFKLVTALDKTLGLLLGLLEALVFIYIALFVLSILPFSFMEEVNRAINGSQLAKFFTEHNLIAVLGSIVNEIDFLREFLIEKFPADGGETAKTCLKSLFFR